MLVHARRKETEALANSVTRHVFTFLQQYAVSITDTSANQRDA
jgi:hypothetical protein